MPAGGSPVTVSPDGRWILGAVSYTQAAASSTADGGRHAESSPPRSHCMFVFLGSRQPVFRVFRRQVDYERCLRRAAPDYQRRAISDRRRNLGHGWRNSVRERRRVAPGSGRRESFGSDYNARFVSSGNGTSGADFSCRTECIFCTSHFRASPRITPSMSARSTRRIGRAFSVRGACTLCRFALLWAICCLTGECGFCPALRFQRSQGNR